MRTVRGKARGGHVDSGEEEGEIGRKRTEKRGGGGMRRARRRVLRDNCVCLYRVTWYQRNILIINSIKNLEFNVRHSILQIPIRISADYIDSLLVKLI